MDAVTSALYEKRVDASSKRIKKMRFQKDPDTCGRGLKFSPEPIHRYDYSQHYDKNKNQGNCKKVYWGLVLN